MNPETPFKDLTARELAELLAWFAALNAPHSVDAARAVRFLFNESEPHKHAFKVRGPKSGLHHYVARCTCGLEESHGDGHELMERIKKHGGTVEGW